MHVSFALRPGKFFVGQLLAAMGMPQSAAFPSGLDNPKRKVTLGPLFHNELEFWRWFVDKRLAYRGGHFSSPMYNIIRPPKLPMFTDASKSAFGGYCLQTGHFFRHELSAEEKSRFCGSSKHFTGYNDNSINVLELLGMLVGAWMLVVTERRRPVTAGDCVLLRGDNKPSVAWIRRCRGGKELRSGALMRMLGALEVSSGWHSQSSHVSGVLNYLADGIWRWDASDVRANLIAACPHVRWRQVDIGEDGRRICSAVLASTSCGTQLRQRLSALTWGILDTS